MITMNAELVEKSLLLSYRIKLYESMSLAIVSSSNRRFALSQKIEGLDINDPNIDSMEKIKSKLSRLIEKELEKFTIWNDYLKNIPGIGPFLAAKLISIYLYKTLNICPVCGEVLVSEKDEGMYCLTCEKKVSWDDKKTKIFPRDFPTIREVS